MQIEQSVSLKIEQSTRLRHHKSIMAYPHKNIRTTSSLEDCYERRRGPWTFHRPPSMSQLEQTKTTQ